MWQLMRVLLFTLLVLVAVTAFFVFTQKTCEFDQPSLYLSGFSFVVLAVVGAVVVWITKTYSAVQLDADPGPCGVCGDSKSAVAHVGPCGHYLDANLEQPRCMECAEKLERCPVCDKKIVTRVEVHRGKLSAMGLSYVAIFQLILPLVIADWTQDHAACFSRDTPPTVGTKGCQLLLYVSFSKVFVGAVASRISSDDVIDLKLMKVFRWLTLLSSAVCLLLFALFGAAATGQVFTLTAREDMLALRAVNTPYNVMVQNTVSTFLRPFAGDCTPGGSGITHEWFSCMLCDEMAADTCVGSGTLKLMEDHNATVRTAVAFLLLFLINIFGIIFADGMLMTFKRTVREQLSRAQLDFFMLLTDMKGITATSKYTKAEEMEDLRKRMAAAQSSGRGVEALEAERMEKEQNSASGNHWRSLMTQDARYGQHILGDDDRRSLFGKYLEVLRQEERRIQM